VILNASVELAELAAVIMEPASTFSIARERIFSEMSGRASRPKTTEYTRNGVLDGGGSG
jgi:hypothetical protein